MQKQKILFIKTTDSVEGSFHPKDVWSSLEIGYAISLLEKENYHTDFIDCRVDSSSIDELLKSTLKYSPDIVIISFLSHNCSWALEYSKRLKKIKKRIIICCIGPHVSCAPESVVFKGSPVDCAILGEIEVDIASFIKNINKPKELKKIKSLYFAGKRKYQLALVQDLDKLPFPKHKLFLDSIYRNIYPVKVYKKLKWGFILSSRGCPYRCIFCGPTIRRSYGKIPRFRSAKNIVDEIEYLLSLGKNAITFVDDELTLSRKHVISICDEIVKRQIKIKWIAHARVDNLSDEIIKKMKKAGCVLLKIGVESGSSRIIRVLKKTYKPNEWVDTSIKIFKKARGADIDTVAMFLVGCPTETKEDLELTRNLIRKIKPSLIQLAYFTPYPGSEFFYRNYNKYKKEEFGPLFYHQIYNPRLVNTSNLGENELKSALMDMYRWFYLRPSFILSHLLKYGLFYLFNFEIVRILSGYFMRQKAS